MTTLYRADGFKRLPKSTDPWGEVQTATDAARVFANRLARIQYGKHGHCANVRPDSWSPDGLSQTFEVFIGTPPRGREGGTPGHNEWITITVEESQT